MAICRVLPSSASASANVFHPLLDKRIRSIWARVAVIADLEPVHAANRLSSASLGNEASTISRIADQSAAVLATTERRVPSSKTDDDSASFPASSS